MEKEIKITQEQRDTVDRYIQLMEQVYDFRSTLPSLYSFLHYQIMIPTSSFDRDRHIKLPREILKFKALAMLMTDEIDTGEKIKRMNKKKTNLTN